jgi:acyl-CoA dehydrogenase
MSTPLRPIELPELTASEAFERALGIAAEPADDVDRQGGFPSEAVAALRPTGALGWGVPLECSGASHGIDDPDDTAFELSRRSSATRTIFSLHQIEVASIARHMGVSLWFRHYLNRALFRAHGINPAGWPKEVAIGFGPMAPCPR